MKFKYGQARLDARIHRKIVGKQVELYRKYNIRFSIPDLIDILVEKFLDKLEYEENFPFIKFEEDKEKEMKKM